MVPCFIRFVSSLGRQPLSSVYTPPPDFKKKQHHYVPNSG